VVRNGGKVVRNGGKVVRNGGKTVKEMAGSGERKRRSSGT
jgi:hypothetical protein